MPDCTSFPGCPILALFRLQREASGKESLCGTAKSAERKVVFLCPSPRRDPATLRKRLPSRGNLHQRKSQLLPFMKAAEQRTHAAYSVLAELQRHPGAGRFVWSSTEQHNLAITRDLAVPGLQILGGNLQGTGQGARVGEHVQRMPQVDDDRLLARLQFML